MIEDFWILLKDELSKGIDIVVLPPFCDQELVNKQQHVKRLKGLERRFIRDNKFFPDYKKYMNELLEKGYARRCNGTPTRKTWYTPHQEVYDPSKPGKMCCI